MSIKTWPELERPREKLLQQGAGVLSDAELIAILLRVGTHGLSAVELGRELLTHFGSLGRLFNAPFSEIKQQKGLGSATYAQFSAVNEVAKRILVEELQTPLSLNSPDKVKDYLQLHIGFKPIEVFMALFLNTQNQIIAIEEMSQGTVAQSAVYIREIVKRALHHNASALIVAHNHPSGTLRPSQEDIALTMTLKDALKLIDVTLLDHFLVTNQSCVSFREESWLNFISE
ncbi:RadC family protein [Neisseria sp. Ec49-e6-T10]|uniref:RadC family protein n=1 Tax=Neisseria sp. Ec49-e6-T10 TaxID=3140744 RepID=UPI003EBD7A1F